MRLAVGEGRAARNIAAGSSPVAVFPPGGSGERTDYSIIVECEGAEGLDAFVRWLRADAGVARTETKLLLRVVAG